MGYSPDLNSFLFLLIAPAVLHDCFRIVTYDTVGQDNTCAHKIVLILKHLTLVLFDGTIAIDEWLGTILENLERFLEVLLDIAQSIIAHEVVVYAVGIVRVDKRERSLASHL